MRTEYELDLAAEHIARFLIRWGRVSVTEHKVKWKQVRVYCTFFRNS